MLALEYDTYSYERLKAMALTIKIKVTPSSRKQFCKLDAAGQLKCYLKSPPEKGKANAELLLMLTKALGLHKSEANIISGMTSRLKTVRIEADVTEEQLYGRLGIEIQTKLF